MSGQGPPTEQVSCLSANALHLPSPISELANNTEHRLGLITTNVKLRNPCELAHVWRGLQLHQHRRLYIPKYKSLKIKKDYNQVMDQHMTRPEEKP